MFTEYAGNSGLIVNVSSDAAKSGSLDECAVPSTLKGAIESVNKGLAHELVADSFCVNVFRPS